MRIVKRILAGFLAVSVLFSSNMICFTAIAEGTNDTNITMPDSNVTEGDFELTIDIPEQWSNDIKKWTITTDDADLFYKISDDIIDEKEWGSYTDDDIKKWNDGEDFDEGEGYIKFWAVKEVNGEEKFVTSTAVPYKYDKTSPNPFEIEKDIGLLLFFRYIRFLYNFRNFHIWLMAMNNRFNLTGYRICGCLSNIDCKRLLHQIYH